LRSRGRIIPDLLRGATRGCDRACPSESLLSALGTDDPATALLERLRHLHLPAFAPFRLLAVIPVPERSTYKVAEASWNRDKCTVIEHATGPSCFVSSGIGDPLVKPRIALFQKMVVGEASGSAD